MWRWNRTHRRLVVHFVLPTSSPATLELLDVSGRRVCERAVGALGAGRQAFELTAGVSVKPGLYFIRLTQGTNAGVVRVVVMDGGA